MGSVNIYRPHVHVHKPMYIINLLKLLYKCESIVDTIIISD